MPDPRTGQGPGFLDSVGAVRGAADPNRYKNGPALGALSHKQRTLGWQTPWRHRASVARPRFPCLYKAHP